MKNNFITNSLSFRDPSGKIYELKNDQLLTERVFRGLRKDFHNHHNKLLNKNYFNKLIQSEMVVKTT